jgi:hypothetical protein
MPGNWDPNQNLNTNTHQVEWPMGPRTSSSSTEAPTWLEAWVVQSSTGASQRTFQRVFGVPGRWTADGIPPGWINGRFQPGPALGIALLASHDSATNADTFFWWLDVIELS